MNRLTVLRILVVLEAASLLATVLYALLVPPSQAAMDFLLASGEDDGPSDSILLWIAVPAVLVLIAAWIGLWLDWKPARYVYLGSLVVSLPFLLFTGTVVVTPAESLMTMLSGLTSGAILCMLFLVPRLRDGGEKS